MALREEAGLDQKTMKIYLGEIERCQKITPRRQIRTRKVRHRLSV
jgi:hypothetical protein